MAGASAQQAPSVQGFSAGDRAPPLHRPDRAVGHRFLVDLRFAIFDHQLGADENGPDSPVHRLSRRPMDGEILHHRREHLARRAFRCDYPARGIADDLAFVLRGSEPRRRIALATIPLCNATTADADHRRGDDVFGAVHVHRFPADLCSDARWTAQLDSLDGNIVLSARDLRRQPGRRRSHRDGDGAVCARRDPGLVFRIATTRMAAGRGGQMSEAKSSAASVAIRDADARPEVIDSMGMNYLVSLPKRVGSVYLPLFVFIGVLLFPFYWMAITALKPDAELLSREGNPFWVKNPTLAHIKKLLFETAYPDWLWNTIVVSVVATFLSIFCSVLAAYAIERLRFRGSRYVGMSIFLAYLVPPSILFIPLAAMVYKLDLFDTRLALILTYPTFLIPFCTWLLMGYFKSIPIELEECALIDGASRLQILVRIILPLAVPGLISAGIFAFTLSWNEFIYALTFISSSEVKTVPVGVVTELVEGDVYHWGSLMAGALFGSLPVAILYSFFVEYYVSGLTGAVKE